MSGYDLGKIKYAPPSNKRPPSYPKFEISAPGANSKIIVSISNENKTYWMHCLTVQIGFLQKVNPQSICNWHDQNLDRHSVHIQLIFGRHLINTWSTLDQHLHWHLINTWSIVKRVLTDSYSSIKNQLTLDQLLTEALIECRSRVDQVSMKGIDQHLTTGAFSAHYHKKWWNRTYYIHACS